MIDMTSIDLAKFEDFFETTTTDIGLSDLRLDAPTSNRSKNLAAMEGVEFWYLIEGVGFVETGIGRVERGFLKRISHAKSLSGGVVREEQYAVPSGLKRVSSCATAEALKAVAEIKTKGVDGTDGEKGDKGDKGEQGEQGDKGETGETGEQGDKGETGETGTDGTDGIITDGSVTTSKIADSAVTKGKLGVDVLTVARADVFRAWNLDNTNNTFLSAENGQANTTGKRNTASGTVALNRNTTGYYNTASGYAALNRNTTGDSNTASGVGALRDNTTGDSNTASGFEALEVNTEGSSNTASGYYALRVNTTGSNNVGVGYNAGWNLQTGSRCVLLGYGTTAPLINSSDKLSIGNTIRGDLGKGNMVIDGKMTQKSDERLKENVQAVADGLGCVKKLRPITFTRKEVPEAVFEKDVDGNDIIPNPAPEGGQRGSSEKEYGLIAQEVEKVCPEIVETSEYAEGYKSIDYSILSVLLLKAVQEQQEQIELLEKRIESLGA